MPKRKKDEEEDDDEEFTGDVIDVDEDEEAVDVEEEEELKDGKGGDDEEEEKPKKKSKKEKGDDVSSKKEKKDSKKKSSSKEKKSTTKESKTSKSASSSTSKGKKDGKAAVVAVKSESEARKLLLDYLQGANRPYSVQNIVDNLHGQIKPTMAKKVLEKMSEDGDIVAKEAGAKSKIYLMDQSKFETLDKDQMAEMEKEIKDASSRLQKLKEEVRALTSEKDKTSRALTTEQLKEEIQRLKMSVEAKTKKLVGFESDGVKLADPAEKKAAQELFNKALKYWKDRKRKTKEIVDSLTENMEDMTNQQFIEKVGVETDEDAGIDMNKLGKL